MNLDEFIEKRTGDGKLDSVGDFTLDSLAALRKTLASTLPEAHYYLFQILQGLVRAGAQGVKVGIGRRENKISFTDAGQVFANLEDLASRFSKGLSVASNDPLDLVMSGMITSLGAHIAGADFYYENEKISVSVDGLSHGTMGAPAPQAAIVFRRNLEKGLSFSWSRIWGARKEEFRIRKAFEYSPINLSIAGLSTTPHSSWRRAEDGEDHFALVEAAVLASSPVNHCGEVQTKIRRAPGSACLYHCSSLDETPGGAEHAVAPNLLMLAMDESGDPIERTLEESEWEQRLWTFCFTSLTDQASEIAFVRNGFTLPRLKPDLGFPGLKVVAPADDLTVDASGYQLVENDAYAARVEQARRLAQRVVDILKTEDLKAAVSQTGREAGEVLKRFDWV